MSDRVNELKAAVREAERATAKLQSELFLAQCEEAGIAPGDLVEELSRGANDANAPTGRRGVAMLIRFSAAGRAWVSVRLLKKDGTVGGATANFFDRWRKVAP